MNIPWNLLFATQQVYKGFPDLFCVIYILYERGSGVWRVDNPQGIDHLDFRPDKFGNQDIVGMVSAEDEVVAFSNVIYPIDAKVS